MKIDFHTHGRLADVYKRQVVAIVVLGVMKKSAQRERA